MEDYRRFSHDTWEGVAPGWERWRATTEEATAGVRDWMVKALSPKAGETILELAAGAGDTGFAAAAHLGAQGRLISTDFSPAMVEVARRRGAALGLSNVEYRVVDAEHIELPDHSVDGVLCRFGYMLMADVAAALSETRRVLRPQGRLVLAVWAAIERNPWAALGVRLLIERGHVPLPDPREPGPFALGTEAQNRALLAGAGFSSIHTDEVPVLFRFPDVDSYMTFAADTAGPFAAVIRGLPDDERQAIADELGKAFSPFAVGDAFELPGLALVILAR